MHEIGMCRSVLERVEARADGRRVDRIGVHVGRDLAVEPQVFEQGFQVLAQGGPAEGATTEVETVPGDVLMLVWIRYASAAVDRPRTEPAGS